MSFSMSRPIASSKRCAISSVALFGAPVDTRLPFRSANLLMPVPSTVTTCMRFGYATISERIGTWPPENLPCPLKPSHAASAIDSAMSDFFWFMSCRLATEPAVDSAFAA